MKLKIVLTVLAAGLLTACAYNAPYRPANRPEKMEYGNDHKDVYPEDVRKDAALYAKVRVVWAGIIVTNDAVDDESGDKINMNTVFEHHYYDWLVNENAGSKHLLISPRGEGRFRMHWQMNRRNAESSSADALQYAKPGSVAVVYGSPESLDDNGTIVMHYRSVRIFGPEHFTAKDLDYGRIGEPYHPIEASTSGTAALTPSP
jgi:hypothetical protein